MLPRIVLLARYLGTLMRIPYSIGRGEVCRVMVVDEQDLEDDEQDLDALLQKLLGVPGSYAIIFKGDRKIVKWKKRR
jgi:2-methylaconitate cis-trans-isomerase PrpF